MPPIPPENSNKKPLQSANHLPFEEYDHLTPAELHTLLTDTFEEYSPIRLHHERVDEVMAEAIPFLKLMLYFLSRVAEEKELKLTAKGNLPRKLCLELYGLGIIKEEMIERGITKLSKEEDSIVIQNLKYISLQSKLTKKRNGKLSLTKKGEKLLGSIPELFREVFITYGTRFNWGFHDGYPDEGQFQSTFGFCLYLLIRYGQEERSIRFYYEKLNTALPERFPPRADAAMYGNNSSYYDRMIRFRLFKRFLLWFNFVELRFDRSPVHDATGYVKTTQTFRELFVIRAS